MDADVTLLQSYANWLSSWDTAGDTINNNAAVISASIPAGTALSEFADVGSLGQIATAIGSQAKVDLYTTLLTQAANDLSQYLTTGTVTPQLAGDPTTLNAMSAWLTAINASYSAAKSAADDLQVSFSSAGGTALASVFAVQSTLAQIYAGSLTPSLAAAQLTRIAQRVAGLHSGAVVTSGGGGTVVTGNTTSSSSTGFVVAGLALATAVGVWAYARKKHLEGGKRRRVA